MADKHLIHAHSSVVTDGQPKLPAAERIRYGEIAVNFAEGYETLSLRNSNDDIVTFSCDNAINKKMEDNERVVSNSLNNLNSRIIGLSDELHETAAELEESKISKIIPTTYKSLENDKNMGLLKPGQLYRITDYVTIITENMWQKSAGHPFDLIVRATSNNTLSEDAKAIQHEGDTYFADANMAAWEIKYCFENDEDKYSWANAEDGKGVIYYMKDEWNNICYYDFKNILNLRTAITNFTISNGASNTDDIRNIFQYEASTQKECYYYERNSGGTSTNLTYIQVSTNPSKFYYTFSWVNENEEIQDASLIWPNLVDTTKNYSGTHDNLISACLPDLPYICFISTYNYDNGSFKGIFGNKFDIDCYDITLCNDCNNNTFGNFCTKMLFGNGSSNNQIGAQSKCIYFCNNCCDNVLANNSFDNLFFNNCCGNTLGLNASRIYLSNDCRFITINNSCKSIHVLSPYTNNVVVENNNKGIQLKLKSGIDPSILNENNNMRNIEVTQFVHNTDSDDIAQFKTIVHGTTNDTFKTIYQNPNTTTTTVS